jgi:hypothetical protein
MTGSLLAITLRLAKVTHLKGLCFLNRLLKLLIPLVKKNIDYGKIDSSSHNNIIGGIVRPKFKTSFLLKLI